ncbi:unnamed protein product, partial [Callosobruchus maculatus]
LFVELHKDLSAIITAITNQTNNIIQLLIHIISTFNVSSKYYLSKRIVIVTAIKKPVLLSSKLTKTLTNNGECFIRSQHKYLLIYLAVTPVIFELHLTRLLYRIRNPD